MSAMTAEQMQDRITGWLDVEAAAAHRLFLDARTKREKELHWRRYTVLSAAAYRIRQGEHLPAVAAASSEGSEGQR